MVAKKDKYSLYRNAFQWKQEKEEKCGNKDTGSDTERGKGTEKTKY